MCGPHKNWVLGEFISLMMISNLQPGQHFRPEIPLVSCISVICCGLPSLHSRWHCEVQQLQIGEVVNLSLLGALPTNQPPTVEELETLTMGEMTAMTKRLEFAWATFQQRTASLFVVQTNEWYQPFMVVRMDDKGLPTHHPISHTCLICFYKSQATSWDRPWTKKRRLRTHLAALPLVTWGCTSPLGVKQFLCVSLEVQHATNCFSNWLV